jgi:hypothetical protein
MIDEAEQEIAERSSETVYLLQRLMTFHDCGYVLGMPEPLMATLRGILNMPYDTCHTCLRPVYFKVGLECSPCYFGATV